MTIKELKNNIIEKYGKCFWDDYFDTEEDYQYWLLTPNCVLYEVNRWEEFGVILIEVADNNMWNCIVVLKK